MAASGSIDHAMRTQVYRWAYRFMRNHHDALDATQDVMVKWLRGDRTDVKNQRAWLRRITVNHCLDLIRTRRRSELSDVEPVCNETPLGEAGSGELRRLIADGLSQLSEQQRAVLVAKVYDRETFASIAESLGIATSSAKTHYVRALRAMGELLRHLDED